MITAAASDLKSSVGWLTFFVDEMTAQDQVNPCSSLEQSLLGASPCVHFIKVRRSCPCPPPSPCRSEQPEPLRAPSCTRKDPD